MDLSDDFRFVHWKRYVYAFGGSACEEVSHRRGGVSGAWAMRQTHRCAHSRQHALVVVGDFRLITGTYLGTDHESRRASAASLPHRRRAPVIGGEIAFVPDDEENAVTPRTEFGPGKNVRKGILKPLVRFLERSVMSVFVYVGSDVGKVDRFAFRKIRGHLGEGHTVRVLPSSGADIREVNQWIVPAVVRFIGSEKPLEA